MLKWLSECFISRNLNLKIAFNVVSFIVCFIFYKSYLSPDCSGQRFRYSVEIKGFQERILVLQYKENRDRYTGTAARNVGCDPYLGGGGEKTTTNNSLTVWGGGSDILLFIHDMELSWA